MNKKALRQKYKQLRQELSESEREKKSLAIANMLLQLDIWNKTYYHLFLPIEEQLEVNTEYLLQILAGKDKEIVISKSDFKTRKMTHYLLTDNTTIQKNHYNIPEPVEGLEVPVSKIEVVFVPLLAYDRMGHRVGYGKGFYDLFLSECSKSTLKVGLSFFDPENTIAEISETDVTLEFCVTPDKILVF